MPVVKSEAFVLKNFRYGETSKIVNLFTKDYGKISCVVKGARNFKSRMCGTLETMNYIDAVIYYRDGRDLQIITAVEYKKSFPGIISNFDKLELSYRIIEMINKSLIQSEINRPIFELLKNSFEELEVSEYNLLYNFLRFQIKLTELMGLSPDITYRNIGNNETFFDYNELNLNNEQKDVVNIFMNNNITETAKFNFDNYCIKSLIEGYERYLLNHTQGSNFYISKKVFKDINECN